jgi:hypothetical protein
VYSLNNKENLAMTITATRPHHRDLIKSLGAWVTELVDDYPDYDEYDLLVAASTDAAGNQSTAVSDYRVLAPSLITDPNGNQSAAAFDALKPGAMWAHRRRIQTIFQDPYSSLDPRRKVGAADLGLRDRRSVSGRPALALNVTAPVPLMPFTSRL